MVDRSLLRLGCCRFAEGEATRGPDTVLGIQYLTHLAGHVSRGERLLQQYDVGFQYAVTGEPSGYFRADLVENAFRHK